MARGISSGTCLWPVSRPVSRRDTRSLSSLDVQAIEGGWAGSESGNLEQRAQCLPFPVQIERSMMGEDMRGLADLQYYHNRPIHSIQLGGLVGW